MEITYVILLGFAVSIDGFFAGIAYGLKGIHIPRQALVAISAITFVYTALACWGAKYVIAALSPQIAVFIGAAVLILLGSVSLLKQFFHTESTITYPAAPIKNYKFSIGKIVILISKKPECADIDQSKQLNITEAILLATALGIDNVTAALAASLSGNITLLTPLMMCIIQTALIYSGILSAKRFCSPSLKQRFNYFPGIILIFLGLLRLL